MDQETLDRLQVRHRKEQRDLQSRITQKKKNATKKTRKGVNDECAELERQLKERQEEETKAHTGVSENKHAVEAEEAATSDTEDAATQQPAAAEPEPEPDLSSKLESTTLSEPVSQQGGGGGKKRNRHKERLARRQAEEAAALAAATEEAAGMTDHRGNERGRMEPVFRSNALVEREIDPDGHCLFAAFADGLAANSVPVDRGLVDTAGSSVGAKIMPYKVVRRAAAGWMEKHGDEFAGFLEEPLEMYVEKIRDTAEWGGQLELSALASAYGVEIRVVQDGRIEVIVPTSAEREDGERKVVWLAYYRHGYGLGEHYNSLRRDEKLK